VFYVSSLTTFTVNYIPGVSLGDYPEMFEWMGRRRRLTCDKSVEEEILPMWSKHPGLIEKLGNKRSFLKHII